MTTSFEDLKVLGQMFIGLLLNADFKTATGRFDETMQKVVSESKLQESWQQLITDAGTILNVTPISTSEVDDNRIVIVRCEFQWIILDAKIVFNQQGQISGLNFFPKIRTYTSPEYVDKSAFHEVDVVIGEGKWALPGTITIPEGPGPFPGLVLVHGSGPNDRDETIGSNKTFQDLAWGLASRNIAVLRYDKRTFKHAKLLTPDLVKKMTVKEEVVDDALLAVQCLQKTDKIDSKRVFLLGHSLGGTVAPKIAQQDHSLAGIIIMAGSNRPIEDLILDQFTYIYSLTGEISKEQKSELDNLKIKVDRLKDPDILDNITTKDMPLGIPVDYWIDLRNYNPLDVAKTLHIPILILQGGRDYQVEVTKDFENWKNALKKESNTSFKVFPKLNHLFIAGEGKSTPQEYLNRRTCG